jgi:predicted translin family RNA/ssDNA-binding protein
LNAYRYPNITWGNQEFMEALSFQHYLETQTLISYEEANAKVASLSGEEGAVNLTPEDYILGIFDMVGELMRFSITSMATNGKLPAGRPSHKKPQSEPSAKDADGQAEDKMDIDDPTSSEQKPQKPRDVLSDLRELRLQLEMLEPSQGSKFNNEVEKKMTVMRECVEKVEKALYGLTVRGQERPKGWVPDIREDKRGVEIESH